MKHKALYLYLILFFLLCCSVTTTGQEKKQERFTLMGLGDSITEGADFFTCYLYPLWEKLGNYIQSYSITLVKRCKDLLLSNLFITFAL